ncbi:DUF6318 family protein [Angustibacter sp. McL0619]|uniref:DUF6318 family protein n=1 Tax=Angustibacter sp. McL0619 TaxID=3415676 RepID=UPI003CEC9646
MIIRGWAAAAAVVLGVTLLAGCSDDDPQGGASQLHTPTTGPSTSPASTASPTTTTSVEAAYARVPTAARAHTYAGAQAFAEFYVAQINRAWTTPDPEALRSYGTSTCLSCDNYVRTAASMKSDGERYDGDAVKLTAAAWLPESRPNLAIVSVLATAIPAPIVNSLGSTVGHGESGPNESEFQLAWSSGRWHVTSIKLVVVK